MFNTDLPSGRRKLFALVLGVFLIVGFSVKYLLIWLGWVGGADQTSRPTQEPVAEVGSDTESTSVTPEEVAQAKRVAEQFIQAYTTVDFKQRDAWLASLKNLTTPSHYAVLEQEATQSRSPEDTVSTAFSELGRMDCEAVASRVSCLAEVIVMEKGPKESLPVERIYQLLLSADGERWVVEEAQARGNFE
ncbi:hypothetical protein ACFQ4J_14580 [Laceyella tengchongensis]